MAYCNTPWEQTTKVGTLHHFCQLEKGHTDSEGNASEHGCVTCETMHIAFDDKGVIFLEVPC